VHSLVAIDDLDGDGVADIVTNSQGQVLIFNAKTGVLEWQEDPGEMGSIGAVRIADLDGDKKADLVVMECACCGVNSGKTAFAYSFGAGFSPPKRLWTAPYVSCGGSTTLTFLDVNGDGTLEVVDTQTNVLHLLDGATGIEMAASADLGDWTATSPCFGANVDGAPGDELVCFKSYIDSTPSNHQVFVVKYNAAATPALSLMWSRDVGDTVGLSAAPEALVDLDGDGTSEIVASGKTTAGKATSSILDAATGAELATIPLRIAGSARLQSKTKVLVLAGDDSSLSAWSFDRTATPRTAQVWKLGKRVVETYPDPTALRTTALNARTLTTDVNGDGLDDLFTYDASPGTSIEVDTAVTTPSPFGTFSLPTGTNVTQSWLTPALGAVARFAVGRTDGTLTLHDPKLAAVTKTPIPVGGYYPPGGFVDLRTTPVVAAVDSSGAQAILVPDSRGALLRLDAHAATFASPPAIVWQRDRTNAPVVVPNLAGGAPGVACLEQVLPLSAQNFNVVALRADGTTLWTSPLAAEALGDVIPGNLDGDAIPDLVVQWGSPSDLIGFVRGLSGSGTKLWDSGPNTPGAGRTTAGHALVDWNGDGADEVIFQGAGAHVLSSVDGTEIATGGPSDAYFMPIPYDVDGDGVPEVTFQGGFSPASTFHHDLKTTVWASGDDDRPYPYGAIAVCPAAPILVEGSWQNPSRLKLTTMSGAGAGTVKTLVLAGGKAYDSETAATAAGARIGQLTSANVHAGLAGSGTIRALVGSSDGWLYAVDPCAATLAFGYQFQDPVGQPVFGDTDGDGKDEIIVAVGDGYLYGLRNEALPPPDSVIDIDPEHGVTTTDVETTENASTLSGSWSAVVGAESYEVAVTGADGAYLTTPAWTNVGNVTRATISKLALDVGSKYFFAVRATSSTKGTGPDKVSDGVVRIAIGGDAGDAGETGDAGEAGETGDAMPDAADSAADAGAEGGGHQRRFLGLRMPHNEVFAGLPDLPTHRAGGRGGGRPPQAEPRVWHHR
jgi:hypothetical protein